MRFSTFLLGCLFWEGSGSKGGEFLNRKDHGSHGKNPGSSSDRSDGGNASPSTVDFTGVGAWRKIEEGKKFTVLPPLDGKLKLTTFMREVVLQGKPNKLFPPTTPLDLKETFSSCERHADSKSLVNQAAWKFYTKKFANPKWFGKDGRPNFPFFTTKYKTQAMDNNREMRAVVEPAEVGHGREENKDNHVFFVQRHELKGVSEVLKMEVKLRMVVQFSVVRRANDSLARIEVMVDTAGMPNFLTKRVQEGFGKELNSEGGTWDSFFRKFMTNFHAKYFTHA